MCHLQKVKSKSKVVMLCYSKDNKKSDCIDFASFWLYYNTCQMHKN